MERWKFNLDSVRQHRHTLEERAAQQVGAALRKLSDASDQAQILRSQLLVSSASYFPRENTTPEALLQLSEYSHAMQVKLTEAGIREESARNNLEHARQEWHRSRTAKEAIDQLFAKKKQEHEVALLREEQKLLDSFASNKSGGFHL